MAAVTQIPYKKIDLNLDKLQMTTQVSYPLHLLTIYQMKFKVYIKTPLEMLSIIVLFYTTLLESKKKYRYIFKIVIS